jgi:tRNA (guanosine-2'-O-)-methyltransferase
MNKSRLARINYVLEKRQPDITVLLENVFDPHNIAAVMRTCDSVGIGELYTLYTEAPPHHLTGFRSSAGSWKWMEKHEYTDTETCILDIRKKYGKIFAAHLSDETLPLYETDFTQPMAIVFGNEQKGCSAEILKYCDGQIFIPQVGMAQSLNISVACAITLYEAFRQKRAAGHYEQPALPSEEISRLLEDWTDFKNVREKKMRKA